jgi:hypothetical protein
MSSGSEMTFQGTCRIRYGDFAILSELAVEDVQQLKDDPFRDEIPRYLSNLHQRSHHTR